MTYMTYTAMELQDLAKQCKQHLEESVSAWLLWLWNEGAVNTELSPSEVSQLASIMAVSSMQHIWQGARCTDPHAGNKTIINWLMATEKVAWIPQGTCQNT